MNRLMPFFQKTALRSSANKKVNLYNVKIGSLVTLAYYNFILQHRHSKNFFCGRNMTLRGNETNKPNELKLENTDNTLLEY